MYYAIIATLMLAFPVGSIAVEAWHTGVVTALIVAKWFAFWAMGLRLFLAGFRQTVQPSYTAREILGLQSEESLIVVRELGFANLALGTVGILSLLISRWQLAAALAGGIFYGLAGANHIFHRSRNRMENVAMVSDLFVSVVLLVATASAWFASS